jgi:hypothetical protein
VGTRNDKGLSDFLGITRQCISQARKKNHVPAAWIVKICDENGFSLEWVKTGRGPQFSGSRRPLAQSGRPASENRADNFSESERDWHKKASAREKELAEKAKTILLSRTIFTTALAQKIEELHAVLEAQKRHSRLC